jgi:hypothetical protein
LGNWKKVSTSSLPSWRLRTTPGQRASTSARRQYTRPGPPRRSPRRRSGESRPGSLPQRASGPCARGCARCAHSNAGPGLGARRGPRPCAARVAIDNGPDRGGEPAGDQVVEAALLGAKVSPPAQSSKATSCFYPSVRTATTPRTGTLTTALVPLEDRLEG